MVKSFVYFFYMPIAFNFIMNHSAQDIVAVLEWSISKWWYAVCMTFKKCMIIKADVLFINLF